MSSSTDVNMSSLQPTVSPAETICTYADGTLIKGRILAASDNCHCHFINKTGHGTTLCKLQAGEWWPSHGAPCTGTDTSIQREEEPLIKEQNRKQILLFASQK